MASSFVQKLKNVGPGALVAAGFVGPGTVTTCTVSGASYGYTMLWALLFATVATIIFQEMAARIGIVTQEGLGENIRDRISHPVLKWIAIVIVIIAIFIGNTAYETGNITGGILGIQAVADVPMIPIVIVLGILAFVAMWAGSYKLVEKILTGIVIFMGLVFLITAFASPVAVLSAHVFKKTVGSCANLRVRLRVRRLRTVSGSTPASRAFRASRYSASPRALALSRKVRTDPTARRVFCQRRNSSKRKATSSSAFFTAPVRLSFPA